MSIRKIAETAFGRVLELNHRHSKARFRAAVHLMKGLMDDYSLSAGFDRILQAAHMRRRNHRGDRHGYGTLDSVVDATSAKLH